jgi:hypothetical protein
MSVLSSCRTSRVGCWLFVVSTLACGDKTATTTAGHGGGLASGSGAGSHAADGGMGSLAGGKPGDAGGAAGRAGSAGKPTAGASGAAAGEGGASGRAGSGGAKAGSGGAAGAGGAAAVSGGGGQAGGDFFGASRCASAGLLLCDGFESGKLDSSLWKTKFSAPSFDSQRAARGGKSLHFSTSATGASGIETSQIFPAAKDTYYGRMFVYFDALPTSPQWAHWTVVGANPTQSSAIKGEIRVGGQFDGKIERFGVGTDGGATGDWTTLDNDPAGKPNKVPEKQWICLEWMHSAASDETRLYVDGVEHMSLHTTADTHGGDSSVKYALPDFGSVWVGFWNYDQSKPVVPSQFDVWIDEVALDHSRIGCTR